MKKSLFTVVLVLFFWAYSGTGNAQVKIGPRISGNLNIYNEKGITGTWNGIGVGVGGVVDVSFSQHIGLMTNLTVFDMRNFSNSISAQNQTQETTLSLSYLTVDPMFKAEFSGFFMVAGPSLGIKLSSSGERSVNVTGQRPNVQTLNLETNTIKFDIAAGIGYNFLLSPGMYLGSDFMVYIPISNTYDTPGLSNSVLTLKLGAALKFTL